MASPLLFPKFRSQSDWIPVEWGPVGRITTTRQHFGSSGFENAGQNRGQAIVMQVIGIGTDICEVSRIEQLIQKHGTPFLDRVYTAAEQVYCGAHKLSAVQYAGRWAAKEAISKALGTGWAQGIAWTDLEVCNAASGKPEVKLHGAACEIARRLGIDSILVSISHVQSTAIAMAVAQGSPDRSETGNGDKDSTT